MAPTSKVVGPRLRSEPIEEHLGNIPVCPMGENTVEVPQGTSSTACCRGDDIEHREISACTQARVQEFPEIQVTERIQELIVPERIEELIGDVPVPPIVKETVEVAQVIPHDLPEMEYIAPASPVTDSLPNQRLPPASQAFLSGSRSRSLLLPLHKV